jgi:hypothetical protein
VPWNVLPPDFMIATIDMPGTDTSASFPEVLICTSSSVLSLK